MTKNECFWLLTEKRLQWNKGSREECWWKVGRCWLYSESKIKSILPKDWWLHVRNQTWLQSFFLDQIWKTLRIADLGGNQEFSFRQIKFKMHIRYPRGLANWLAISEEQCSFQISSCKSSGQRWYLKQSGQMRSLS